MSTLKKLWKSPLGFGFAAIGGMTLAVIGHRMYLKPYLDRQRFKRNEEIANIIYEAEVHHQAENK